MSRLNRSKNRLERQTDESAHGHFAAWSAPQSCRVSSRCHATRANYSQKAKTR
jgi:hypothetical protein